jgi:sarcosine oxidase gamma subunit
MVWRRSWAANWDSVRYCSDACRRRKVSTVDAQLEAAILQLLHARARGATICPSEAARAVAPDEWRELMEPARRAARRLMAAGTVEITQAGRVVDPSTAKGPIRVRLT